MPGTGYDKDAERIGLNISRRQRWIALASFVLAFAFAVIVGTLVKARAATMISGQAIITDADTLKIDGQVLRLAGVDAPETDQTCLSADRQLWPCGLAARDALAQWIAGRDVQCSGSSYDINGRLLVACFVGGISVDDWLVRQGWAVAFVRYREGEAHIAAEATARAEKRGLWRGCFVAPWDWRRLTLATGFHDERCPAEWIAAFRAPEMEAPSPDCVIKGNVDSKVYHLPGCPWYRRLDMTQDGSKRWFCTEAEATAAGLRLAGRCPTSLAAR